MKKEASDLVLSLSFISDDALWLFAEIIKTMEKEMEVTRIKIIEKQILDESFLLIKNKEDQRQKGRVTFDEKIVAEKMEKIMKTREEIIISVKKEVKMLDDSGYVN